MGGRVLTSNLDADVCCVVVEVGNKDLANELVEVEIFFDHRFHLAGEGTEKAVGQENAEKRSDERPPIILPRTSGG